MTMSKREIMMLAMGLATKVLREISFSYNEPVNIFQIIEDKNIILNFQPLDNLAGAYIPQTSDNLPGILINEKLPIIRQRYTAAHELCHYIRNDSASVDTCSELFMNKYKRDEKEQIAEAFASCLLMPRRLINNILKQLNVSEENDITVVQIYELSLRMDTSYQATVNSLLNLNIINKKQYEEFYQYSPKKIKDYFGDLDTDTPWNNIWTLTESDNKYIFRPLVGDEVKIELKESPSTGFKWEYIPFNENVTSQWVPDEEELLGSSGKRIIKFKITEIENLLLTLRYKRPWLPNTSDKILEFYIYIQQKRHGIKLKQLVA